MLIHGDGGIVKIVRRYAKHAKGKSGCGDGGDDLVRARRKSNVEASVGVDRQLHHDRRFGSGRLCEDRRIHDRSEARTNFAAKVNDALDRKSDVAFLVIADRHDFRRLRFRVTRLRGQLV